MKYTSSLLKYWTRHETWLTNIAEIAPLTLLAGSVPGSKRAISPLWKLGVRTKKLSRKFDVNSSIPINWFISCYNILFAGMTLTRHKSKVHCPGVMQCWACSSLMSAHLPAGIGVARGAWGPCRPQIFRTYNRFFKENLRYLVWTCRDPIFNSRDPNRVPKTTLKNPAYSRLCFERRISQTK